MDDKMALYRE